MASISVILLAAGVAAPSSWGQDPPPEVDPVVPGQAVPEGAGEVHSWTLAPAGSTDPGEAGNRPNLSYEVDPGAVLDDAVTLYNFSNVQLTFRVYATDGRNNEDGQFDLLPGDEAPTMVGTWITLPQAQVTVPAGRQVTMPITVRVPEDADPGDYAGAILATSEAVGTGEDGKVITLDRRTGTRVYVRVAGALRPELAIENVETRYRPALNPLGGTATVTYRIQNRGNVRMSGAHSVAISGPFGMAERRIAAADFPELLPGESFDVKASFDDVPAAVVATATVRLDPAAGAGSEEQSAITRQGMAFAPPLTIILLTMALALGLRARAAYRRHRREAQVAEVQPA